MIRFDGTVVHRKENQKTKEKIKQNKTMTCKSLSDTTMESRADQRGPPSILSPALRHHTRSSSSIRHYSTVTAMVNWPATEVMITSSRLLFQYLLGSPLRVYLFDLRRGLLFLLIAAIDW